MCRKLYVRAAIEAVTTRSSVGDAASFKKRIGIHERESEMKRCSGGPSIYIKKRRAAACQQKPVLVETFLCSVVLWT